MSLSNCQRADQKEIKPRSKLTYSQRLLYELTFNKHSKGKH